MPRACSLFLSQYIYIYLTSKRVCVGMLYGERERGRERSRETGREREIERNREGHRVSRERGRER
jgi:hypothetical protein